MPIALLDVNVLIALAWPNHVYHKTATDWFARQASDGWATCPITECGFVRISSNPRLSTMAATPMTAWEYLTKLTAISGHTFWPDDIPITGIFEAREPAIVGHQQVTDAYLIALAKSRGGRLATFDRGVATLGGNGTNTIAELITAQRSD